MNTNIYLPAYPLLTSDPYISIWSRADHPARQDATHWAGERKRLVIEATVDGERYALVGRGPGREAELTGREVTATRTRYEFLAGGARVRVSFRAPLLLDDAELFSVPATYLDIEAISDDGRMRDMRLDFTWHDDICYDGAVSKPMLGRAYETGGYSAAYMGQKKQAPLCHSGDHITIDWGYAYLLADEGARFERAGGHWALCFSREWTLGGEWKEARLLLGYDDVSSIRYFDDTACAWYARNGRTLVSAMCDLAARRAEIFARLDALDQSLYEGALRAGGEKYAAIAVASYRHSIAAHKLIADRDGNMVFLSKENDSNGCIGTADVAYPSMPLYLLYAPELVNGMCRPLLRFAETKAWKYDFAPHDVGRYPYATGQVYGLSPRAYDKTACDPVANGDVYPPFYLDEGEENLYALRGQMPVEECGNIILMLACALRAGGDDRLIRAHLPTLEKWVKYLEEFGADPGEQLCTDDFAGHLARNVNLAMKAICGLAAWGWIQTMLTGGEAGARFLQESREMAGRVLRMARTENGTALTLDGQGWSLKYNAVWDRMFGFGLFGDDFYQAEIARYLKEQNEFGVPLDSRRDYTKSDWIMWAAAMSDRAETVERFAEPIADYLKRTPTRVPFGDWYDTKTGAYCHFIARSVQGGIFMPMLWRKWTKDDRA